MVYSSSKLSFHYILAACATELMVVTRKEVPACYISLLDCSRLLTYWL